MKTSDYIVNYLVEKGITDAFGYPGGMVTSLMDSFYKYKDKINAHVTYHEQGAAFSACGYAQTSGKPGIAYATSGPGATNLITGICNAYFDSIPTIFITGQVNSHERKGESGVRQRGFQETDITSMVSHVTKYSAYVESEEKIKYYLDRAFYESMDGRKGPVLLDIPMNILKKEIDHPDKLEGYECEKYFVQEEPNIAEIIQEALKNAQRPCILIGNGVKIARMKKEAYVLVENLKIPVVTSMVAIDVLTDSPYYYGFIGAYGARTANFIIAKSDLIITLGSRLDVRQVGAETEKFAPNAKLIRIDIDYNEFHKKVHMNEQQLIISLEKAIILLNDIKVLSDYSEWVNICDIIKGRLSGKDDKEPNLYVKKISEYIPDNSIITTDVGQNQVWVAQSFQLKQNQEVLFSGGHGAMGYSLPAAIGACYGSRRPVTCFNGDGGFQMNIQELQFVVREKLPIKIIIMNNSALGMIRHFQEMYFENRYFQTKEEGGYTVPDFCEIATAYGIKSTKITSLGEIENLNWDYSEPELINVILTGNTYVFPKLEYGKPNQNQEPLLDSELYNYLMSL